MAQFWIKKLVYLYWLGFDSNAETLEMLTEREGFEPSVLLGHPISSRAHSTTLPPLLVIITLLYHLYHRTVVAWIAIAALVLCNKL